MLFEPHTPSAIHFMSSDCLEYVREDCFCIYDRIDGFLTLIWDKEGKELLGFKLKGVNRCMDYAAAFLDGTLVTDDTETAYRLGMALAVRDGVKMPTVH